MDICQWEEFAGEIGNANVTKSINKGNINGNYYGIGGIVGINTDGIVNLCYNTGYIYLSEAGFYGVAGIVGKCRSDRGIAKIEECYNNGEVYNLSDMDKGRQTAGIVGNIGGTQYQSEITNCYNTGYIHGIGAMGGIASWGNGYKITNCYNIGKLFSDNGITNSGIICATSTDGNNENINNYWLDTCGANKGSPSNVGTETKTSEELKQLASSLSDKFTNDVNNINNGYPILKWQLENK